MDCLRVRELASSAWQSVAPIVFVPRTDGEYERLVAVLDALIDTVGEHVPELPA